MEFKPLKTFTSNRSGSMSSMLGALMARLDEHGEVQFTTKDGAKFSIHLGDLGFVDDETLTFIDEEGQVWTIHGDCISNIWTHLASKEA